MIAIHSAGRRVTIRMITIGFPGDCLTITVIAMVTVSPLSKSDKIDWDRYVRHASSN